jgi:hypothetical protein
MLFFSYFLYGCVVFRLQFFTWRTSSSATRLYQYSKFEVLRFLWETKLWAASKILFEMWCTPKMSSCDPWSYSAYAEPGASGLRETPLSRAPSRRSRAPHGHRGGCDSREIRGGSCRPQRRRVPPRPIPCGTGVRTELRCGQLR